MTVNDHIEGIREDLQNFDLKTQTAKMLVRYGWDMRFKEEGLSLPHDEFMKIDKRIQASFNAEFPWHGPYPFTLFSNLLGLKDQLMRTDEDSVIGVVGNPGQGKTTVSIACSRFLDYHFSGQDIIMTYRQFQNFMKRATRIFNQVKEANEQDSTNTHVNPLSGKCIVIDEGVFMMFSGDSNTKEGRQIQKLFSVIRALNLIVFINITKLRKVNWGVMEDRMKALIKVPTKGLVQFYSKKKIAKIEFQPRKIKFPKPNFYEQVGYIGDCDMWREYERIKSDFLVEAVHDDT